MVFAKACSAQYGNLGPPFAETEMDGFGKVVGFLVGIVEKDGGEALLYGINGGVAIADDEALFFVKVPFEQMGGGAVATDNDAGQVEEAEDVGIGGESAISQNNDVFHFFSILEGP